MNIQEYIATGIIECYVLGATTTEENLEVERLAEEYPEIKQEIEANKFALSEYIMQYQVEPPKELKDKVMSKLDFLFSEEEAYQDELEEKESLSNVKPISLQLSNHKNKIFSIYPYMAAASILLFAISLFFNVLLYNRLQYSQNALNRALAENVQLAQNFKSTQTNFETLSKEMVFINHPATKSVELKGLKEFPEASVVLYWDTQSKDVFVHIQKLPPAPKGKQYQLWAIEGKEVKDAGMIEKIDKNLYKMKNISKANAFAITLEKEGGVPKAEGAMYVMGKVI